MREKRRRYLVFNSKQFAHDICDLFKYTSFPKKFNYITILIFFNVLKNKIKKLRHNGDMLQAIDSIKKKGQICCTVEIDATGIVLYQELRVGKTLELFLID